MALVGVNNEPLLERAIFAYDGSDYRVVKCDTDGQVLAAIATGQTIEVTQDTAADLKATVDIATGQTIEVTQDTAADLKATVNLGGANELGIVEESVSDTNLGAGTQTIDGTAIPSGQIHKVTHAAMYVNSGSFTSFTIRIQGLATLLWLLHNSSPSSGEIYTWTGEVFLQEGDYMQAQIVNCTSGDDAIMRYCGERVK